MYYLKVALIAALALAAAPGPAQRGSAAPGAPPDHPFAQPLWDDGRAEAAVGMTPKSQLPNNTATGRPRRRRVAKGSPIISPPPWRSRPWSAG